jgi:hypothetical protein
VLLCAAGGSAQTDQTGGAIDSFAAGAQVNIAIAGYGPGHAAAATLVAGTARIAGISDPEGALKALRSSNSVPYNPVALDLKGFAINWGDLSVDWGDGTVQLALNPAKKSSGQILRKAPFGPPGSSVELEFVFDLFLEIPVHSPQGFTAFVAHNEEPLHLVGRGNAIPPLETEFTPAKSVRLYDAGMNEVGSLSLRSFVPVQAGHGLLLNQMIDLARGFAALAIRQK